MTTWEDFRVSLDELDEVTGEKVVRVSLLLPRQPVPSPQKNGWVEVKACTFLLSILELKVFLFTV